MFSNATKPIVLDPQAPEQPATPDDFIAQAMRSVAASMKPQVFNFGVDSPISQQEVGITVIVMPTPMKKVTPVDETEAPVINHTPADKGVEP